MERNDIIDRKRKKMKNIISSAEVNIGRQDEFDYLKGIFMLFIFLIHAFQATMSDESSFVSGIYMFATMSGAAIFIFVMGFGTAYSKKAAAGDLGKNGVRMILYQYLNNLLYIAALSLPYPFIASSLSEAGLENFKLSVWIYFQYTNIFFITGVIYLVLAVLKKLGLPTIGYLCLGILMGLIAPFLYGTPVDVPVLGYIVTLLIGDAMFVSFTPLYFLSYALIGVAAGKLYRRLADKRAFYRRMLPACSAVAAAWWLLIFYKYGSDFSSLRSDMGQGYVHPDLWRVVASLAHIFVFAAIIYFICNRDKKDHAATGTKNRIAGQILYYSRHISKYYALHIVTYFVAFGFHGYLGFSSWQCWLLMLLSMIVTEIMVRLINRFLENKERTLQIKMKTIAKYTAPYVLLAAILLFRLGHLNSETPFLTPQQFDTIIWAVVLGMVAVTQVLYTRNKRFTLERARAEALAATAREIQSGIVPQTKYYSETGVELFAAAQPAKAVGGDFYDIIPLTGGRIGIVMGDVSGKGVPAALFMSVIKTMIKDRLLSGMSPEEALNAVNNEICAENPKGMFATVFAGVFHGQDGKFEFANAGHTPPVRISSKNRFLEPDAGIAIGLFEDAGIIREEVFLKKGEGLFFYTDGATEAINAAKEPYGQERLLKVCDGDTAKSLIENVTADVAGFSYGLEQFDDLTMLALFYGSSTALHCRQE